ncbi:OLC1v1028266C1 [Oldenlandia corymbosa var. corymbosa]|uniref:OLC1v1028266C1 n=1 Tax=Oldenlandia corymbosa var. corymbosa TaxID=529605 RepID=A0AAV1CE23_OLDCO|nr:OLC1v1028266C1 [Oldenlandia corymbosa var. corymbosa]
MLWGAINRNRNSSTTETEEKQRVETFTSYSDHGNGGVDIFKNYVKNSQESEVNFENYAHSIFRDPAQFTSYGENSTGQKIGFNSYVVNYHFKEYGKSGVTFKTYLNETSPAATLDNVGSEKQGRIKYGVISSNIPFSTSKITQLKKIFHAGDDYNSIMAHMIRDAMTECERAPSPGETKRCVSSGEDMIDFATSVLDRNLVVRTTENTQGSNRDILIGSVNGINGGSVTKSVSCHQSLYPYLLYYCHSVPKVRVYEADILDPNSKVRINHWVAICHMDTSSWSPGHGAFLALGSGPGKIEVCHWKD